MIESDFSSRSQVTSSKPRKMPQVRRRRPAMPFSSSPVNQVDAQGTAYLCFPEDHSWFQGTISTDDESNYSLYGERVTFEKSDSIDTKDEAVLKIVPNEENNNAGNPENNAATPAEESDYYRVTMIDHFSGQKSILPKIIATKPTTEGSGVGNLFTSQHGEVTFEVENVYKGQKADMMIHQYVGSPTLLGTKCLLYSGQINILFNDIGETGRSWSL